MRLLLMLENSESFSRDNITTSLSVGSTFVGFLVTMCFMNESAKFIWWFYFGHVVPNADQFLVKPSQMLLQQVVRRGKMHPDMCFHAQLCICISIHLKYAMMYVCCFITNLDRFVPPSSSFAVS